MRRFLRDESGATAIEYALIATIVSLAIVAGATLSGTSLKGSFEQVSSGFSSR
ncbi:Flp family type IVb pilin [Enterovirga aerilata]|uniref:Flp family type IVb pilin n=1 Tax=Enterovirga aerilata TaxID=2730920 RepID=A0A849HZM0_9HYPH|nr:Flp family type IVb pilin [Enterovirga sp. DB1703]NNM72976.1 Flp family type IVb pilin [Enterovirga sp. DB1703]